MIGFLAVYNGGEGTGFDDYLSDMGEKAISDGVIAKIDAVQANIDATTVPLVDQVSELMPRTRRHAQTLMAIRARRRWNLRLYANGTFSETKAYMFYDFAVTMNVTIPDAAGDND